jgi:hypothetical protein
MKVYLVEFTHKETKKKFYKFGMTKYGDVMKRFSREESISFGRDEKQYDDFDIRVIASAWNTFEQVEQQEKFLLKKFPKNFIVEEYLGTPNKKYKFSGVTECVVLDSEQLAEARKHIYGLRKRWGNDG